MESENETAELNAGQTTQSQCPPGQTLSGHSTSQMPASGQVHPAQQPFQYQLPASGQVYPGQQPAQYQMPTSGRAPPGQQPILQYQMPASGQGPPGQQPVQYQMPASGQAPPGQQPVQYQMPASGQAPPGQQPVRYQMPAIGQVRPRRAEPWTPTQSARTHQQSGFSLTMDFKFFKSRQAIALYIGIVELVIAIAFAVKFKEMYSPSSYSYGGAVTRESTLTDQKLEFFLGATISALILCFLNFFTFFLGLYNLFGVPTNSIAVMTILCMAWAIMLGGGTGAMAYRCYQVWDSYFLWRKQSMFGSTTDPLLIYRVCIIFATVFGFLAFCSFDDYARAYHKLFKSLKNLEPGTMGQHYPRAQQPVPQQNLGLQNLAMQQDPGSQRPFMQQHPRVQQPVMQQHAGAQQNDPGV